MGNKIIYIGEYLLKKGITQRTRKLKPDKKKKQATITKFHIKQITKSEKN